MRYIAWELCLLSGSGSGPVSWPVVVVEPALSPESKDGTSRNVSTPPAGALSWDVPKGELFDQEDRLEITGRADESRAQVRAHRLAEIRKRQHATQVELAARMGVCQARSATSSGAG